MRQEPATEYTDYQIPLTIYRAWKGNDFKMLAGVELMGAAESKGTRRKKFYWYIHIYR